MQQCERVLVVNDDVDTVDTLRDLLELHGVRVATATGTSQAEQVVRGGFIPSVVLVDLRLGQGPTGSDLVARFRADPGLRAIPIVLMSADVHTLRQVGTDVERTVEKPFDIDRLLEILSEVCAGARS